MVIKNAVIYNKYFETQRADILCEGENITALGESLSDAAEFDFSGCTVLPGFIDIHIHGCNGADMEFATPEALDTMSKYLASKGVTSFCPASMTLPEEELSKQFSAVGSFCGHESGAYIHGVNMEGPYISLEKKGAQEASYVRRPDFDEFSRLSALCRICLVDVAPESDGALEFARRVSKMCTVSAAHTASTYEQAKAGFENGFSHATHLYNAMPPVKNREPGTVTAVFDSDSVTAELICDGFHNHPAILRTAFKILGEDRPVVVSDSMRAAGCDDGDYQLGGQTVYVRDGKARLSDGTIAASTTNIYEEFINLISFGIPFKTALKACTINPARVIGADKITGSIEPGKRADLLILDSKLNIVAVIIKGKLMKH